MHFIAFLEVEVQDKKYKYKKRCQKWPIFHKYKILSQFRLDGWQEKRRSRRREEAKEKKQEKRGSRRREEAGDEKKQDNIGSSKR